MNKAEAMFRAFFENDAEYVLFHLAHRVQVETLSAQGVGSPERWDEIRVFNDAGELAVFDDKPNFVRVYSNVAVVAYVRKADGRPASMCAAGAGYECHRPVKQGPAQMARFDDGTIVEQYWVHGVRQLTRDVQSPAARGKSAKGKTRRDEGPLESLGKAVSSPVRGTADEEEGEKPA